MNFVTLCRATFLTVVIDIIIEVCCEFKLVKVFDTDFAMFYDKIDKVSGDDTRSYTIPQRMDLCIQFNVEKLIPDQKLNINEMTHVSKISGEDTTGYITGGPAYPPRPRKVEVELINENENDSKKVDEPIGKHKSGEDMTGHMKGVPPSLPTRQTDENKEILLNENDDDSKKKNGKVIEDENSDDVNNYGQNKGESSSILSSRKEKQKEILMNLNNDNFRKVSGQASKNEKGNDFTDGHTQMREEQSSTLLPQKEKQKEISERVYNDNSKIENGPGGKKKTVENFTNVPTQIRRDLSSPPAHPEEKKKKLLMDETENNLKKVDNQINKNRSGGDTTGHIRRRLASFSLFRKGRKKGVSIDATGSTEGGKVLPSLSNTEERKEHR